MNRSFAALILSAGMIGSVVWAEDTNKTEAAPKPTGTPKIVFDKTLYDFGTTSMVSSVTGTFTFHNAGDAVLEVKKPRPSCGCTVAYVKPETLKPGEKGELGFTVNLGNMTRGSIQKNIIVPSNDPQSPSIDLTIKATMVPIFETSLEQVSLGNLHQGTTTNVTIHVKRVDGKKLALTKVDSTSGSVHPQLETVASTNGTETEIRIEVSAEGTPQRINSLVRAYADNPNQPVLTIPVYGQVVGDVSVAPEAVIWGILDPERGSGPPRTIRVASNKADAVLEIKNLTSSLKDLTVTLVALETGKVYQIVASLPVAPKESERGTISFDTNIASQPTVVVPVNISVLKR